MGLFDSVINEAREKFDLGDKVNDLLSVLITMITAKANGGFGGFLESFNKAGLGDLASSWVNSGANMPISYEQTESVFGEQTLKEMSEETGIDYKTTTSATAFMVPHIVDELTPNGEIPNERGLMTMLGESLPEAEIPEISADETLDRIGTAAVGTEGAHAVQSVADSYSGGDENSVLKILLPLILIAVLLGVGYMFCGKSAENNTALNVSNTSNTNKTAANANASTATNSTAKTTDSSFTLKAENGKYIVSGIVPDEATKKQIMDALTAQYGAENVDFAGLKFDATAKAFGANWWDNFSKLLPSLKGWSSGELSFAGNALTVASDLPQAALDQIKSLFGTGWKLPVSIAGAENAVKQANEEALTELAEAKSVEEVVKALNVSIINFASGSSAIPADAASVLQKAAEVLKAQPANTKIEIGGYTDTDGNDDANLKLSESRANSVKSELVKLGVAAEMLLAKGYGESNPVAANDTPDNKFKNRRIEYKVVGGDGSLSTTETKTTETNTANTSK